MQGLAYSVLVKILFSVCTHYGLFVSSCILYHWLFQSEQALMLPAVRPMTQM